MAFFSQYRGRKTGFRWLAAVLSFCLAIPYLSVAAQAGETSPAYSMGMLCPHHQAHDEACGYGEAQPEQPCGHAHDNSCTGEGCIHSHDEFCGWREAQEERPCAHECGEECKEACLHTHNEACGYGEAQPEQPCGHVHDEGCGWECGHIHDEGCGYAPAMEAAPCAFFCETCAAGLAGAVVISGWSWESGSLEFLEDVKLWGLGFPGANAGNPVTAEALAELLPQEIAATLAGGTEAALPIAWDYGALPEDGLFEGSFTLTAALPEGYALAEGVPALEVLVAVGGGETYEKLRGSGSRPGPVQVVPVPSGNVNPTHKFVNNWSYEVPTGGTEIINNGSTTDFDYSTTIALQLAAYDQDALVQAITAALPKRIECSGSNANNALVNAGFTPKEGQTGSGTLQGYVNITWWNVADAVAAKDIQDGTTLTLYADPVSNTGYLIRVNTNDSEYKDTSADGVADTAEAYDVLNLTVTLKDIDLSQHTVPAASPENVTVNLFDYWVNESYGENPSPANGGDILGKSDSHAHEILDTGEVTYDPSPYSTKSDWNLGINKGHLLLFGDGLIHAGLWNKGAGENTRYGKRYAGMEQIVKNTLNEAGYPEINLENANKVLTDERDSPTVDPTLNIPKYELIKDYRLAGDHNNDYGAAYNSDDIKNLSNTVVNLWKTATNQTLENGSESLQYLFDPDASHPYKNSYENITGLFQLDDEGYYYYNMRENFAEFEYQPQTDRNGLPSDGRFILYDAPATTRTDGKESIGNFFPFNKGAQVFNGLKTVNGEEVLTSSIYCANNEMNHHLGMTVNVDFRQPANGQINTGSNAKPMTFEFSGDDDVWVFIDDVLVLDIGGTHSELYGTINFHTGDVYIGRAFDTKGIPENPADPANMVTHTTLKALYEAAGKADTTQWNGETFSSNTVHKLNMFYLERGNYDSSIALRFNLQPMLPQRVVKVDQNGRPIEGVVFELYEAAEASSGISCLYTDGVRESTPFYVQQTGNTALVSLETDENGSAMFLTGDNSYFNFADRGNAYYVLKEKEAPAGYRKQPVDIVLYYDQKTAMLSVANRWTTGAYACSVSNIAAFGQLNYGRIENGEVVEENTLVTQREQTDGLIVAVPLLKKRSNNDWLALSGSNLTGFASQEIVQGSGEEAWKKAVLTAALRQAWNGDDSSAAWRLAWNEDNNRLEGILYDLPGLATRYRLLNPEHGDMHMVYGIISSEALKKVGVTAEDTIEERYKKFGAAQVEELLSGFRFLSIDQFNRDFRSMIYIPNERRELWVRKVDQGGQPLENAEFGLYDNPSCSGNPISSGFTSGDDGMLIFSPNPPEEADGNVSKGYAKMEWANSANTQYYLKEITPPPGHQLNQAITPIIVGVYSIYADAGDADNSVSVLAGAGRLTQTMRQYAMDNNVDITLQDITAFMQAQPSGNFTLDGWLDTELKGTDGNDTGIVRSMNLHFGKNAEVDYGLHNEDGGLVFKPFFTTDTGFIRARIQQNWPALTGGMYEGAKTDVNKDNLGDTDLTNLFSLLNIVVVMDKGAPEPIPGTGQLTISKKLSGIGYGEAEYTKLFQFTVSFMDADGKPLDGAFNYYFYGEDKAGTIKNGSTLLLHHDEAVTILGLPVGTTYTVTETPVDKWHTCPENGVCTGSIDEKDKTYIAAFTNSTTPPPKGSLTIEKTVSGENLTDEDRRIEFTFMLLLKGEDGTPLAGSYPYTGSKSGQIQNGGTIALSHGQSVTISGLPEGAEYTVTEVPADGWKAVQDQTGTIVKDVEAEAAFINSKTPSTDPGDTTGSLTIKKTVSGDGLTDADRKREFAFTVELKDKDGNALTGKYQYTGSKSGEIASGGGIALSHGQSVTITGLPEGTKYTITEAVADGWKEIQPKTGGIVAGQVVEAVFVNTKPGSDTPGPEEPKPNPPKDPDPKPKDPEEPKEPQDPEGPKAPEEPTPPEEPEHPVNPGYPTELPDPNDPDSPDEITIWEDDVPKTYIKIWEPEEEEYIYVPEDEIPLAPPPRTGRTLEPLWLAMGLMAMAGAALPVYRKIEEKLEQKG